MNAIDRLFRRHLIVNWYGAIENDGIVITRTLQEPFILPKSLIRMVLAYLPRKNSGDVPNRQIVIQAMVEGGLQPNIQNAGLTPKKCR